MFGYNSNFYNAARCGGGSTTVSILSVIGFVLFALGLMTLAKRKGINNAWLAWIPIANLYIMGKIIGHIKIGSFEMDKMEMWLPLSILPLIILLAIPFVRILAIIAFAVIFYFAFFRLFSKYRSENAVLFSVLSVLLFTLGAYGLLVFLVRNDAESA